mgnify:CR=1 FL=1
MTKIIGRKRELQQLEEAYKAEESLFVVVYGRRRVGKTFLVREAFDDKLAFYATGVNRENKDVQLMYFYHALCKYSDAPLALPKTWLEAFDALIKILEASKEQKKVVFLDELSWMNGVDGSFLTALEWFWNSWASLQDNLKLFICGSVTLWTITNIIDSKGGLHNRVTHEIALHQFTLHETELYLLNRGFNWSRLTILQAYMCLGGVPYYLSLLSASESLAENLDRLFFDRDAELQKEYSRLYKTLFKSPEPYMKIVKLLAESKQGLTRQEISTKLKISGKALTDQLGNLQSCDIIRLYYVKDAKIKKNGGIYQLMDFYSHFYLKFAFLGLGDAQYCSHHLNTPAINNWYGMSFERVCLAHVNQIKTILRFDKISTQFYSWRSRTDVASHERGAQIDIIIDRADDMINVCEVKYSKSQYELTKSEFDKLQNRINRFRGETKTKKGVILTMITTEDLLPNKYANDIDSQITLNDLFDTK